MRYKRKRRSYRSRVIKMKFQSFVDLSTEADTMKIISVNAGGRNIMDRLGPFFSAYKYYKLGGVSIKLIPASTLPVDPLGLSYSLDDVDAVDPRDQLTPGMCRITNGEDILEDITGLTGDQQRQLYDNMLLDPRWYKWMLQTGVKRFGKPRYWQIGQLHQDKFPGSVNNFPNITDLDGIDTDPTVLMRESHSDSGNLLFRQFVAGSSPYGIFQTGKRGVLGWMPTDALQPIVDHTGARKDFPLWTSPPEVELFKILMPPVRKTNYYYRMFITETVYFKEPIVMGVNSFRPLDVFHVTGLGVVNRPVKPSDNSYGNGAISDALTGGNYGDDQDL